VNYIGLHDDAIAELWTAFITHDHFDGVRHWNGTVWGAPLASYREQARDRLSRVAGRPYLVSQHDTTDATEAFIRSALQVTNNFEFCAVDTAEILGAFPNAVAKSSHTDRWLLQPSVQRVRVWRWIQGVLSAPR
jgi:hypothetical protein